MKKKGRATPSLPRARAREAKPIRREQAIRTPEIEEYILERVRRGETVISICDDPEAKAAGVPCRDSVYAWIARDEERKLAKDVAEGEILFSDKFAIATNIRVKAMGEELLSICDDGRNDTYKDEKGNVVVDHDHIQRSKLRVETRKWLMSKLAPREYGDKPAEVNVSTAVHNHQSIHSPERIKALRERHAKALDGFGDNQSTNGRFAQ